MMHPQNNAVPLEVFFFSRHVFRSELVNACHSGLIPSAAVCDNQFSEDKKLMDGLLEITISLSLVN